MDLLHFYQEGELVRVPALQDDQKLKEFSKFSVPEILYFALISCSFSLYRLVCSTTCLILTFNVSMTYKMGGMNLNSYNLTKKNTVLRDSLDLCFIQNFSITMMLFSEMLCFNCLMLSNTVKMYTNCDHVWDYFKKYCRL